VSIGEVLTAAQGKAGLTAADVSRRTRIRETIVREIERDDFSSCGGDFYARGHVRAIAHVLGVDPEPLVRDYDFSRMAPPPGPSMPPSGQDTSGPHTPRSGRAMPPSARREPPSAQREPPSAQREPLSDQRVPDAARREPPSGQGVPDAAGPGIREPAAERPRPGAEPGGPGAPAESAGPAASRGPRTIGTPDMPVFPPPPGRSGAGAPSGPFRYREPRRPNWSAALLVLLAIVAGLIIYHVVTAHPGGGTATAGKSVTAHKTARGHPAASKTLAPASSPAPANVVISLTAVTEPCWVNLTTSSGATIYQGVVQPGSSETWSERAAVTLRLGNPGAITLTVDGKSRTGLGSDPVTLTLGPGQATAG